MANATVGAVGPGATPMTVTFSFLDAPAPGVEGDVPMGLRLLRPAILKAAGYFGDGRLVGEATGILTAVAARPSASAVEPDLRAAVYQTAAHSSSNPSAAFDQLKAIYLGAREADERERALHALGYSPAAVPDALDLALRPEVRAQDVRTLVVTVAGHAGPGAARGTWDWFKANWDGLHAKLGGNAEASRRMGQILEGVASASADPAMLDEVDAVYEAHKDHQAEPGYSQRAKEAIQASAKWVEAHGEAVCSWVAEQQQQQG